MNGLAARVCAATMIAVLAVATSAAAQSVTVEASQTAGYSSEDIGAAATQVRAFGDVAGGVRFMTEAAWGVRSDAVSDAFGSAYPYDGRVQAIEAYGERTFQPRGALLGVRVGRYRTPFGISGSSDHAYVGFLRAPLMRYDGYYALSNEFLEHGADVIIGAPRLFVETSVGTPADVGEAQRRHGLDAVVRVQAAYGGAILGASYIDTRPYQPPDFAQGRTRFGGIDGRWMRGGVMLRGEWISGRPFDGTTTDGGYLDVIVHRPRMGPVTAVFRAERLVYDAEPPFALAATRYTAGARIRFLERAAAEIGLLRQTGGVAGAHPTAIDVAVTYTVRTPAFR